MGQAFNSVTHDPVPLISGGSAAGAPAQVQAIGASPFEFDASVSGLLTVYGGEIELKRAPAGVFRAIGLTGGAFRLLPGDSIRVTWFSSQAPDPVIWYPDA